MTRRLRTLIAGGAAAVLIAGTVGSGAATAAGPRELTIADKGFTESEIVANVYKEALETAGYDVELKSLGTSQIADAALRRNEIQAYPEYTGTALTTILKRTGAANSAANYRAIRAAYARRGLVTFAPSPYNNDNRVACTRATVNRYKLKNLSDLRRAAPNLVYSANPEHLTRADGLPLLVNRYRISFKSVEAVAINQRYKPIQDRKAQCVYAFGTDPQIAQLGLVVLNDDRRFFQGVPYENFLVVNRAWYEQVADKAKFDATVNAVSKALTSAEVRRLNKLVDLDGEDAEDVANDFVTAKALGR
jgi:osmoprotectant transport system substrate-binding protein